jgi:preflagellin peptidase FlaK
LQLILDLARSSIAMLVLSYASWSDYKTREVSNRVWLLFAPVAFGLTTTELLLVVPNGTSDLLPYATCFGLTSGFAILIFYTGGFGGADAKALMCLALALPFYPDKLLAPITHDISLISQNFFPISVFTNSVLFAALAAVAMLFYNLSKRLRTHENLFQGDHKRESIGKKILVLLTGYKIPVEELKEKWHVYPLEAIEKTEENRLKRKLIILPKDEGRKEIVDRIDEAIKSGAIPNEVWATPGLPMLIFILAGLITALFFGDIIWICMRLLLR